MLSKRKFKKILYLPIKFFQGFTWWFINLMPDEPPIFDRLRGYQLKYCLGYSIGTDFKVKSQFVIRGNVKIGFGCRFNRNVSIKSSGSWEINIGNNVLIASNVVIRNTNHGIESIDTPIRYQAKPGANIIIEDDVWIASNAVILPGITIGRGSVVAAGAVVNKNVEPFSFVGGVPAKLIKKRI